MLNSIATQKPFTLNPFCKICEVINIITALITSRKNPRVTTVIGKVKKINIGFTKTFITIRTKDTKIAMPILVTSTPGINVAIKNIATAVDRTLAKKFMKYFLQNYINIYKIKRVIANIYK